MAATSSTGAGSHSGWHALSAWWSRLAGRRPIISFFIVIIWPNALWSVANLVYNAKLIVSHLGNTDQQQAFWLAVPLYSGLSWIVGLAACAWLVWPVYTYLRAEEGKREMTAALRQRAERRLVNLPVYQLVVNFLLWMPGGAFFPLMIALLGGTEEIGGIAVQFLLSFLVSAVVTTFQTFVLLERFLVGYLYPRVFTDVRPAEVPGAITLAFQVRLWLVWGAVSLGPIIVLVLITFNLFNNEEEFGFLPLTIGVIIFGIATGGLIFWLVGQDLAGWLEKHIAATREIAGENFNVRIPELRSDEWGRLTDSFNKMAGDLGRGRQAYETIGHFVGPEVRERILEHLAPSVQEITVMFADIRGFTPRSAGKAPEEVVDLLNRFLSLAVQAIEAKGGWVNKFLGDGFMGLFGAPLPLPAHADCAVAAARDFLVRLDALNRDLAQHGQSPLKVGIGIHTGKALVGFIGSTVPLPGGKESKRGELTAIGETVNLTQRIEELTKSCQASILLSASTHGSLQQPVPLTNLGPHEIRGAMEPVVVYRLD
jgi:class 3 adenylate cyclase